MVGLKNGHIQKTKTTKKKTPPKMVNPRDLAGEQEEEVSSVS